MVRQTAPGELYENWLDAQVQTAVATGRAPLTRLHLIRGLAESTDLDVKAAKEIVDDYCERHAVPETVVEPYRRVSPWIVAAVVAGFLVLLASNYGLSEVLPRLLRMGVAAALLALGAALALGIYLYRRAHRPDPGSQSSAAPRE
ncbi:MAG: hypothetical protein ACK47B_03885 [Armatimonadota bacterium]